MHFLLSFFLKLLSFIDQYIFHMHQCFNFSKLLLKPSSEPYIKRWHWYHPMSAEATRVVGRGKKSFGVRVEVPRHVEASLIPLTEVSTAANCVHREDSQAAAATPTHQLHGLENPCKFCARSSRDRPLWNLRLETRTVFVIDSSKLQPACDL